MILRKDGKDFYKHRYEQNFFHLIADKYYEAQMSVVKNSQFIDPISVSICGVLHFLQSCYFMNVFRK